MSEILNKVQLRKPNKSVLNIGYPHADTCRFGEIKVCYQEHLNPGDYFKVSAAPFVRLDPLSAPIMGQINVTLHYFFVPYRLVWKNWEDFITGGRLGTAQPEMPYLPATPDTAHSRLLDSLSMERTISNTKASRPRQSALSLKAYWKIMDDYYRDQNLMESLFDPDVALTPTIDVEDGLFTPSAELLKPFHRAYKKDLFTSALPFPQRGAPMGLPVGGVVGARFVDGDDTINADVYADNVDGNISLSTNQAGYQNGVLQTVNGQVNIEDLREANAIQRWLERNAIGGGRYTEQILSHFNVRVPDYRLQRPEFLGGVTTPIIVSQVLQNSQTSESSPLGTMAGHGIAATQMRPFKYRAQEHGVILGVYSIIPAATYSQGVNRNNLKFDKLDYFFPEFENLGEQEIKNAEIYVSGNDDIDNRPFGYAPRYYEYKLRQPEVHGDFRTTLQYWLPQRIFSSLPALNNDFVQVDASKEESLNNIFAVTDSEQDQFRLVVNNSVIAVRPMSKYSRFNF